MGCVLKRVRLDYLLLPIPHDVGALAHLDCLSGQFSTVDAIHALLDHDRFSH